MNFMFKLSSYKLQINKTGEETAVCDIWLNDSKRYKDYNLLTHTTLLASFRLVKIVTRCNKVLELL